MGAALLTFDPCNPAFFSFFFFFFLPFFKLLTYHVVPNAVGYSTSLTDGQKLPTVEGSSVTISTTNGIKVDDAAVVIAVREESWHWSPRRGWGALAPRADLALRPLACDAVFFSERPRVQRSRACD